MFVLVSTQVPSYILVLFFPNFSILHILDGELDLEE
jgi:hypothetical protein